MDQMTPDLQPIQVIGDLPLPLGHQTLDYPSKYIHLECVETMQLSLQIRSTSEKSATLFNKNLIIIVPCSESICFFNPELNSEIEYLLRFR